MGPCSLHPAPGTLPDCIDIDEGAGRANRLRHGHREEEGRTLAARRLSGDQIRANVLDDVDAIIRQQDRVDGKASIASSLGITSTAHVSLPTNTTF